MPWSNDESTNEGIRTSQSRSGERAKTTGKSSCGGISHDMYSFCSVRFSLDFSKMFLKYGIQMLACHFLPWDMPGDLSKFFESCPLASRLSFLGREGFCSLMLSKLVHLKFPSCGVHLIILCYELPHARAPEVLAKWSLRILEF